MNNYVNDKLRNEWCDDLIKMIEDARDDEYKLYEAYGYLKSCTEYREKKFEEYYRGGQMENMRIKSLIYFYKGYIKYKEDYIKSLESGEEKIDTSHYYYQCGLLQAYSDMLAEFIEVLGGEENESNANS